MLRHLLYIYSGILFALFLGIVVFWLYFLPQTLIAQTALDSSDRLSIYIIAMLSIVGILLFFNLRRLWKISDLDDSIKKTFDTKIKKLDAIDARIKTLEDLTYYLVPKYDFIDARIKTLEDKNIETEKSIRT